MSDYRPCPYHPEEGDILWVEVFRPAGPLFPGGPVVPEQRGALSTCRPCMIEQLRDRKR